MLLRLKKMEIKQDMKVQTAAKALLQKNLNWRRVVEKAKSTANWDKNDYKTYCYEDSLPQGASE